MFEDIIFSHKTSLFRTFAMTRLKKCFLEMNLIHYININFEVQF